MALIETEEAAKRLARVILSDIELYFRERPRVGETLDGQIIEGRRLFASRVTPALAPLFDTVLADRRASNREKTPAPSDLGASGVATSGVEASWMQQATPGPVLVAQLLEDQATPMPLAEIHARAEVAAVATPVAPTSAPDVSETPAAGEISVAAAPASDATTRTPAPVAVPGVAAVATTGAAAAAAAAAAAGDVAGDVDAGLAPSPSVLAAAPADLPGSVVVAASASASAPLRAVPPPPPPEAPVPQLTPRISVARLLVLLAIVAVALALVARALS
jgi:hypothetical protein